MPVIRVLLGCAAATALAAVTAEAGQPVTAGDQRLTVSASVTPNKPSSGGVLQGVELGLHIDYESLNDGAQIVEHTKAIAIDLPQGMFFHPGLVATCRLSLMLHRNAGPAACDPTTQVGDGTAVTDARPAAPGPIAQTVQLFNGTDDRNPDGSPRNPPVPALIVNLQTPEGVNTTLAFDFRPRQLVLALPAPSDPPEPQADHLQKLDLRIANQGTGAGYVTAPLICPTTRKWPFGASVTNYDGPPAAATTNVTCQRLPIFPPLGRVKRIGRYGPTIAGFRFRGLPRSTKLSVRCVRACQRRLRATGTGNRIAFRPLPATARTVLEIDAVATAYSAARYQCVHFVGQHGVVPIFRRSAVFPAADLGRKRHC